LYPVTFDLWKPNRTFRRATVSGKNTFPRMENGVPFPKCRTCCNTPATAITMAESKSAAS